MHVRERRLPRGRLSGVSVVVVVPDVDPAVLGRKEGDAEHQAADDRRRQPVKAGSLPRDGLPLGGQDVVRCAPQRASKIDEHVEAEQQEPHHRRRTMEPTGDLERMPVEKSHGDSTSEQHHCGHDEQRREQPHRQLWRPVRHVRTSARVVAGESPARCRELQQDHRDQGEPDEDVPRHERVHSEQDRGDLDEDRHEQEHSYGRRQALVSIGVHLRGTVTGPGTRR